MIKGIDSQVIVQRTTEYSKQASQNTFNAEQSLEFAKRLERERADHHAKTVNKSAEAEGGKVSREKRDNDKGGRGSFHDNDGEDAQDNKERELADMAMLSVGYVKYKLDIEV